MPMKKRVSSFSEAVARMYESLGLQFPEHARDCDACALSIGNSEGYCPDGRRLFAEDVTCARAIASQRFGAAPC